MTQSDQCSWSEQWICGWLSNPVKRENKFYADLKVQVTTKAAAPQDYEIIVPARKDRGYIVAKEVQIPEEVYLDLL